MNEKEFNLLCENMVAVGFTDPVLCRPEDLEVFSEFWGEWEDKWEDNFSDFVEAIDESGLVFLTIGGHHRIDAADVLEYEYAPATIVTDPDFDDRAHDAQLMRHNMIHGKIDPTKFMELYDQYAAEMEDDLIQEMFGFADEREFQRLLKQTTSSLPKELQDEFKKAKPEIKNVADLSKVLNHLFSNFGDTLDHGYMILDYGDKDSLWLRMHGKKFQPVLNLFKRCITDGVAADHVMEKLLDRLDTDQSLYQSIVKGCPKMEIPADIDEPTLDNLEGVQDGDQD
jgi:hypothetical protein